MRNRGFHDSGSASAESGTAPCSSAPKQSPEARTSPSSSSNPCAKAGRRASASSATSASPRPEAGVEKLKELGETVKVGIRRERQPSRLPQETLVREKAKKGPPVVIEETREERRVAAVFHDACGAVHRRLGFDGLPPAKRSRTARGTLRHIAAARVANPESKLGTARRLESDLGVSIPVRRGGFCRSRRARRTSTARRCASSRSMRTGCASSASPRTAGTPGPRSCLR